MVRTWLSVLQLIIGFGLLAGPTAAAAISSQEYVEISESSGDEVLATNLHAEIGLREIGRARTQALHGANHINIQTCSSSWLRHLASEELFRPSKTDSRRRTKWKSGGNVSIRQ